MSATAPCFSLTALQGGEGRGEVGFSQSSERKERGDHAGEDAWIGRYIFNRAFDGS